MRIRVSLAAFSGLAALVVSPCTFAAPPSSPPAPAPASPPPAHAPPAHPTIVELPPPSPALLAAIRGVKASAWPSANSVRVLDEDSIAYQPDGTYRETVHRVSLVLTESGRNDTATDWAAYETDHDHIESIAARVIRKDGTVVDVPASAIKDTIQGGAPFMNIYDSNARQDEVHYPGLAVGDATEFTYVDVVTKPYRDDYFDSQQWLQGMSPVLSETIDIDGPASLPLTFKIFHPERGTPVSFAQTMTKKGSGPERVHYHWAAKDEPQMIPEMLMDFQFEAMLLKVSTDPSWKDMSRWVYQLDLPKMKITPGIQRKVAELTHDAKTDAEKVKDLYDFVSQDVRYRGGAYCISGIAPKAAADTLTSRWGVCRDVATLLTTMLRADGFEAYPVITNAGERVQPEIAQLEMNHEILVLHHKDEAGTPAEWQFIDPTAKNSIDLLPGYEREQQVLVATPDGMGLMETPAAAPSENLGHATATSTLDAAGTLDSKVTITTTGVWDLVLRGFAATMSLDQQKDLIERVVHASLPQATLVSYHTSPALALKVPMRMDIEVRVPGSAVEAGKYRLLRTLVTSGALGLVENILPQILGGEATRKYGLDTQVTFEYDEDETVTLPAGLKVDATPNDVSAANAVSDLESRCRTTGATLTCHRSFAIKTRYIDPNQYTELRSVLGQMGAIGKQPVIAETAK